MLALVIISLGNVVTREDPMTTIDDEDKKYDELQGARTHNRKDHLTWQKLEIKPVLL